MDALRQQILATIERATHSGHLLAINSDMEAIREQGTLFAVRYAPDLVIKIKSSKHSATPYNPFLPPEPELTIAPIGAHHRLILNKFSIMAEHSLLITNRFVEQTDELNLADFLAIAQLLAEIDGLVFYNGGQVAGASQSHRHFQLIDRDLGVGRDALVAPLLHHQVDVRFQYRAAELTHYDGESLFDTWRKLEYVWQPYNLLISREYMLVVPRSQESVSGISINAMAYAGALLAKTEQELAIIREPGPIALLNAAGVVG